MRRSARTDPAADPTHRSGRVSPPTCAFTKCMFGPVPSRTGMHARNVIFTPAGAVHRQRNSPHRRGQWPLKIARF